VTRPVLRLVCVLAVAGVAIAVVDLLKGVFLGSHSVVEKVVLVAISVGLVVLAAPIINAARPVRRPDRP
jgi:predicted Co/Zn/Cd cation transporter (cation efflux family)